MSAEAAELLLWAIFGVVCFLSGYGARSLWGDRAGGNIPNLTQVPPPGSDFTVLPRTEIVIPVMRRGSRRERRRKEQAR